MNEQETAQVVNRIDTGAAERIANLRMGLLEACDTLESERPDGDALVARLRALAGAP